MRFFKRNTENKATSKLPMTGKVKKGYRAYCVAVLAMTIVLGTGVTAFAANDPITVVNNLSDFIFRTYPCNRTYPARLRYRAGRTFFEVPRPVPESKRFSYSCRRYHHYFRKRNPYSYHRLRSNSYHGAYSPKRVCPHFYKEVRMNER